MARVSFQEYKKQALANPEVAAEYENLEEEYAVLEKLIKARKQARLTQAQLAEMLSTKQPAIARIEKGPLTASSLQTIIDYVHALGFKLKFDLLPLKK